MAGMWIKKSIFTVKIPLIAPTLGGPGPPDLYIGGGGGGGPPLAPPVPTPMDAPQIRTVESVLLQELFEEGGKH